MDSHDHDPFSCPQCMGMMESARIIGGFAEAMEKMIKDGVFERMGREMAMRREEAFWDAFLKEVG